ncbi:hypothetical protein D9757_012699 [Collybiopsis confluens]|uniref:ATP-dependent DNA helicase n=1 Tax=Collybiopsis confluens TaxID=2823264 RepID=A0A8H5LQX1_9AGAR|nr:hypothetical protein D9757_012699 [Collybiopsis confluens]
MFPWLFPFGLGGIGSTHLSDSAHKRFLMMYHDKRFQMDLSFPFVAFSHEQIKAGSTQLYIMASSRQFDSISQRIQSVNPSVLQSLATRMANGEFVKPSNEHETACFDLLHDVDHGSSKVSGSVYSKKLMRHEIWSLITCVGGPAWYFTLAPCDHKHPICLYYADTQQKFDVPIRSKSECRKLISKNPAAGARFFHFLVSLFLEVVVGTPNSPGLFGPCSAHYCTVEQQGRLALHLHGMIWAKKKLSPQEIKVLLLDPLSDFQQRLIAYLESVQIGEFMTGTKSEVEAAVHSAEQVQYYVSPEYTLPLPPPKSCLCNNCEHCLAHKSWLVQFKSTVDDLLLKSNLHNCKRALNDDGTIKSKEKWAVSCLNNKYKTCKARFPRTLHVESTVDPTSGHVSLRKSEEWLNDISPALTYLVRCNTDVTCLLSGTAIKAVVAYVTDYITKSGLKTHVAFDALRTIFEKNTEMLDGDQSQKDKSRQLLTKMVNLLATKLEIGAPMICLYLLQNPDHYSSHKFVPFYWKNFVTEARKVWSLGDHHDEPDTKVVVMKQKGKLIGVSSTLDYVHRPEEHENIALYDWIRRFQRTKSRPKRKKNTKSSPVQIDGGDDNEGTSEFVGSSLSFLSAHPLQKTHSVRCFRNYHTIVPNFIGPPLPRPDKDDREFYCSTILAFFKPWRSGFDLKCAGESWDEAFTNHVFGETEFLYIKNMNIRYECLDSRDDYRTQMKKGSTIDVQLPPGITDCLGPFVGEHGDFDLGPLDMQPDAEILFDGESGFVSGKRYLASQQAMNIMRDKLLDSGWAEPLLGRREIAHTIEHIEIKDPKEWLLTLSTVRQDELNQRKSSARTNAPLTDTGLLKSHDQNLKYRPNIVEICDQRFFESRGLEYGSVKKLVEDVIMHFSLNEEQERAFRIVAQHSAVLCLDPLRMYIGGMGGTGKSQVIKALLQMFELQHRRFAIVVTAPTGNAAALLGGSTYHYMLGINSQREFVSKATMAEVCTRLEGVEYVIIDEVSMLDCYDMYRISEQLAKVKNRASDAFGGMNMIFAGDFAQLPPIGGESVSLYSHKYDCDGKTLRDHCSAIGKALWHQVTTVVILRKNMRNTGESDIDIKFRTALENMRYKACTPDDIRFLKSLVSSDKPGRHYIGAMPWHEAPLIVGENKQKDEINRMGCIRFAQETDQQLTHFYSADSIGSSEDDDKQGKRSTRKAANSKATVMSDTLQKALWNLTPSAHEHNVPSVLSLCRGLPVIIRHNFATELSITKGQRGFVHSWHSLRGPRSEVVLDVLFVRLLDPPNQVNIPGLPAGVVPVPKRKTKGYVLLPDDSKIYVSRVQVDVLPAFAMTAHASQGQGLQPNATDLNTLSNHHAYYTALLRSRSASQTVILQGFDNAHMTGGASGSLRREYRELELLNDVTRLRYEGKLDQSVAGSTRSILIDTFRKWKGSTYVPPTIHSSIRWNAKDPWFEESTVDLPWTVVDKKSFEHLSNSKKLAQAAKKYAVSPKRDVEPPTVPQSGENSCVPSTVIVSDATICSDLQSCDVNDAVKPNQPEPALDHPSAKRKYSASDSNPLEPGLKKFKSSPAANGIKAPTAIIGSPARVVDPPRLCWSNNSCAYDALFLGIWLAWVEQSFDFAEYVYLRQVAFDFAACTRGSLMLEEARDNFRRIVQDQQTLRWGCYTSTSEVLLCLLRLEEPCIHYSVRCPLDHPRRAVNPESSLLAPLFDIAPRSIAHWIANIPAYCTGRRCRTCREFEMRTAVVVRAPSVMAFSVAGHPSMAIDRNIVVIVDGVNVHYTLKCISYFSEAERHYISRVFDRDQRVFVHDGMVNGGQPVLESAILHENDLSSCRGSTMTAAIYVRVL